MKQLRDDLGTPNTTVLLGPDVVIDFSIGGAESFLPLSVARCVTLTSVDSFPPKSLPKAVVPQGQISGQSTKTKVGSVVGLVPQSGLVATRVPGPGRTPRSHGPLLNYGSHSGSDFEAFLRIDCVQPSNQHVRISGIRLEGPSRGQQSVDQYSILIWRCIDIEVSNMEIAGWGGSGVLVRGAGESGREPQYEQIRIFNNYIHHNQNPRSILNSHTAGYGVDVEDGAWAQIYFNLFDFNRHAIAASGDAGGYDARWNLVLKGGGYHRSVAGEDFHTHQFDIHGTGDSTFEGGGKGGTASTETRYFENSFQYVNSAAISIRGTPKNKISIGDNIFPHQGLEEDKGDDAIKIWERDDIGKVIELLGGNDIEYDSYGRYGVCDFDGDGIDDLFLATGRTWWFSSRGEFPWAYLSARIERVNEVSLGYFDNDLKCDVLTQSDRDWVIASGGTGPWTSIGAYRAQLSEVAFGRFDPARIDRRPNVTRQTTHAFRRLSSGQWQVTTLNGPAWQNVQSSGQPMSELRFRDFTGDGVTDVIGMNNGRWAISKSAREPWSPLNASLGDDIAGLYFGDLNNNNIDDILKISAKKLPSVSMTYTWHISEDGRGPWRELKSHTWTWPRPNMHAFAGRFGEKPGGAVLVTAPDRIGNFFGPAEGRAGLKPDWQSKFAY